MGADRLFNVQRRERLMEELRRTGAVRVPDLAVLLGVSELTIRRDLAALAAERMLTKVHGGAVLPAAADSPSRRPRARRTPFTIGMVVPSLDFYWPTIVAGARSAAAALGARVQLRGSSYDPAEDRRQIIRLVEEHEVQGLLVAPNLESDPTMIGWIAGLPVPAVLVERQPPRWTETPQQLEWVRSDHALGLETAVQHLVDNGHRRIGLVLSQESPTSAHLARGWAAACADRYVPDGLVFHESVRLEAPEHRRVIGEILRECARTRTKALIVHSDPDAMSLAQFCGEHGMSIPRDLALVSYDDDVARLAEPALTAVRPAKNQVGRAAVELIVARLAEGRRRPVHRVSLVPELVIRASSVSPPRAGGARGSGR